MYGICYLRGDRLATLWRSEVLLAQAIKRSSDQAIKRSTVMCALHTNTLRIAHDYAEPSEALRFALVEGLPSWATLTTPSAPRTGRREHYTIFALPAKDL